MKQKLPRILEMLPRQERFNAYVYAYNTLMLGPRLAEHLAVFARGISEDLEKFAEEHARNYFRRRRLPKKRKK